MLKHSMSLAADGKPKKRNEKKGSSTSGKRPASAAESAHRSVSEALSDAAPENIADAHALSPSVPDPARVPQSVQDWNNDESDHSAIDDVPLAERLLQRHACQVASGYIRPASAASDLSPQKHVSAAGQSLSSVASARLPSAGPEKVCITEEADGDIRPTSPCIHLPVQHAPAHQSRQVEASSAQYAVEAVHDDSSSMLSKPQAAAPSAGLDFEIDVDVFEGLDMPSTAAPVVMATSSHQQIPITELQAVEGQPRQQQQQVHRPQPIAGSLQQPVSATEPFTKSCGAHLGSAFDIDIDEDFDIPDAAAGVAAPEKGNPLAQGQAVEVEQDSHDGLQVSALSAAV